MKRDQLQEIVYLHSKRLFLFAIAVTGNRELAEDAVQEALVACMKASSDPENAMAYVCTAVRNAALRALKSREHQKCATSSLAWVQVEGEQLNEAFAQQVNAGLRLLPSHYREAIVLHIYGGLSFREIGEMQDRSINTVASWYRRGISQLKNRFTDDD